MGKLFYKYSVCFIYLVISFPISRMAYSQNESTLENPALKAITEPSSSERWMTFKKDISIPPLEVFTQYKEAFGLGTNDDMKLVKQQSDDMGFIHYRYIQLYQNLKVEGAEFMVHSKNGKAITVNGKVVKNLNLSSVSLLSENTALQSALNYVNAVKYMWEDTLFENALKRERNDPLTTYYPKGELLITLKSNDADFSSANYVLAYKFDIASSHPYDKASIYIDANRGNFLKKRALLINCSDGATNTLYNGYQNIKTDYWNKGLQCDNYRLKDDCRGGGIRTLCFHQNTCGDCDKGDGVGYEITDHNNFWAFLKTQAGASAHWAAEMTYDYYLNKLNRYSYDNNNSEIKVYVTNNNQGDDNAFWDRQNHTMNCGEGGGGEAYDDIVSLDVIGHEITHGVTQSTSNLDNQSESGALNESFSDIFGTMVEFYGQGGSGDYFIGEDFWIADGKLRDMSNPNSKGHPDTYGGTNWDLSDPHVAAGVQNFWFYLLAEGGSDFNDLGNEYCVHGIGRDKAAKIAYDNLTLYLISSSDYLDARNGSIQAALDLYGSNSNEVAQVISAWYAVGVGPAFNGVIEINDHTVSGTEVISYNNEIVFNNLQVPNATSLTVTSNTKITMNPVSFASSGSYFHAYIAPACTGGAIPPPFSGGNGSQNSGNDSTNLSASSNSDVPKNKFSSNNYLSSTYPNPFTESALIQYSLKDASSVSLNVYNIFGQQVATLVNLPNQEAGVYQVTFHAGNLPSGIYFYTLRAGSFVETKKMVLMK